MEDAEEINQWFIDFGGLLCQIFQDKDLHLKFNYKDYSFRILTEGKEFKFTEVSDGYAAILDIVVDLILKMQTKDSLTRAYQKKGIVSIDEVETHLHLELQKMIMPFLTKVFPNIQFIMSTHSPFIINSVDNAVIYDLEKKLLVKDGLSDVPYTGIVEGYFNANEMSVLLQKKFDRYKELANKEKLTEEDFDEIAELEMYLNEVPDYLALNLTTEYQRLKEGLRSREDI